MGSRELAGIAGPLYALPYGEFVAARTAAAKEVSSVGVTAAEQRALAAEVRALPKPSLAAWAVNMLAAHSPEILREVAGLGTSMQEAQDALNAADLRLLAQQRRQLLASAVKAAHALAAQHGRAISAAVATEVEQTLRAATADPGAAAAVQSGWLLRGLSADGVDVVDLTGAVAVPGSQAAAAAGTGAVPATAGVRGTQPASAARGTEPAHRTAQGGGTAGGKPPTEQPRLRAVGTARVTPTPSAVERARAGLEAAEVAAAEADEEAGRAAAELAEATAETTLLADEVRELRRRLDTAEAGLKTARKRHELAAALAQQTARAADRQRRKEVLARERVLRLGNTPEE
ncbi:hypothetical protein [Arthrobacter sp. 9MFCol3.1]|uniref:hypothetical protein n=1 Tax=Arthrobacter sp. 9MFCol3.1 TaxID=1150398 RepID=UPI00047A7116|nr:hypothetical protein [Arthrobacter sp. 9MFCol3.1]